jgi:hypothetical protein
MPTLDLEQKQLLVHYPNDDYPWHHRLLLIPLGGSSWIWATPDLEVERVDVDKFRVVVLARASAFPPRCVDEVYAFDPVSPAVLNKLLSEARSLAAVLGATLPSNAVTASHVIWRISDTSHPDFGEEIPAGAVGNPDIFVPRGSRGKDACVALVCIDGDWTTAARETGEPGLESFARRFHSGAGRDSRIMADSRDSDGRRFLPVLDIVKLLREAPFKHWPIDGPRTVREFMLAVRASGIEGFISYHNEWLKKSGVGEKSNAGREHRFLLEVLRLLCQWDQLDPSSLASAEIMVRRVHQIEMAVKRNPKQPDYEGLDAILDTAIDSSGAVVLPSISSWLAEKQRDEAFVLKQNRLWSEEKRLASSKKKTEETPGGSKT